MTMTFKCSVGEEKISFPSKYDASAAGWALVEIAAQGRNKYLLFCPEHFPPWLKQVMSDGKRSSKD